MKYRVLLVESNRIMLERLSSVIKGTKDFELVARYQKTSEALGQGLVFEPNLILLDIDADDNITLVPEFRRTFPEATLICLGARWNAEHASHLVRAGAKGYLIKPFTEQELLEAVATFRKSGMAVASEVLAFFSPKGKSGKTTLIANLAQSLARQSGESVGIIDADLQFGDMAVFFNLTPKTTIVEAVRDIKFLSPVTLNSYFMPISDRVSVLCGARKLDQAELVSPKAFADMVHMAQSLYRYVLIDLSPGFNPISIAAAELSDVTYMVAMVAGGFEVQHMKKALEIFKDWPNYSERLQMIFTRVSPCDSTEQQRIEAELGYPLTAILPNEFLLVSAAANNGRMAQDIKPESAFSHHIDKLAGKIIGKQIRWDAP